MAYKPFPPRVFHAALFRSVRNRFKACEDTGSSGGFTLVEVVVAMAMATALFTALAYAATTAIKSTQVGRQNQQAADLANQTLEDVRSLDWGAIVNDPGTLQCGVDPNLDCSGDPSVVVDGTSEEVLQQSGGLVGLAPDGAYPVTYSTNGVDYQVFTYVTTPTGGDGDSRRITAYVNWDDYGTARTRVASTIVTNSTRGLPLPEFNLTWASTVDVTANPGSRAVWKVELTNQGAPDWFNLTNGEADSFNVDFYLPDANGDLPDPLPIQGVTQVPDQASGTPALIADQSATFYAVYDIPAESANGSYSASVVATSVSQPDADSATESIDLSLTVTDQVIGNPGDGGADYCPASSAVPSLDVVGGYNQVAYKLHNSGNADWPDYVENPAGSNSFWLPSNSNGLNSTTQDPMAMNFTEDFGIRTSKLDPSVYPDATISDLPEMPSISTDLEPTSTAGRLLYPGTTSSTNVSQVANWHGDRENRDYRGNAILRLFVKPVSGVEDIQLTAQVFRYNKKNNSGAITDVLTPTATSTSVAGSSVSIQDFSASCDSFQEVWFEWDGIALNGANGKSKQQVLGVRVFNTGTGSAKFSTAYDHEGYPAVLQAVEE